mgnify:CR=1 FL=1
MKSSHRAGASARTTQRMYAEGKSAEQIAAERNLAVTTIYGHLYERKVLDPETFITQELYERAEVVYSSKADDRYLILDSFMTPAAKAAFYFLRRLRYNAEVKQ